MYAVIEMGGKQYRVELGSEIQVDRMDVEPGTSIELERVLLVADGDEASIGAPMVSGALVRADVLRQDRGEKIVVFKYKPKARRRVKKGHRADLTILRISEISLNGRSAAEDAEKAEAEERKARAKAEKEAAAQAGTDKALADKLAAQTKAADAAKAAETEAPAKGRTRKSTATPAKTEATAKSTTTAKSTATETKATTKSAKSAAAAAKAEPATKPDDAETKPKAGTPKKSEPAAGTADTEKDE